MAHPELLLRQQRLLIRSALLRSQLGAEAVQLKGPLALLDSGYAGVKWLAERPRWTLVLLVFLALRRPRRALTSAGKAWWTYRMLSRSRLWFSALSKSRF